MNQPMFQPSVRIDTAMPTDHRGVTVEVDPVACANLAATRLRMGGTAIAQTEVYASAATRKLGPLYQLGEYEDGQARVDIGSVIALALDTCPDDQDIDMWASVRASMALAHEFKHREDEVKRGKEVLAAERKSYERRKSAAAVAIFATYMAFGAAVIGAAEFTKGIIAKHPIIAAIAGIAYLAGSVLQLRDDLKKTRTTFQHYYKRPGEIRARKFEDEYLSLFGADKVPLLVRIAGIQRPQP